MTGAALTARTAMSNCWCLAASDMSPGGRCGYQTNQMSRSAARARTIQMPKSAGRAWARPMKGTVTRAPVRWS